jgi:hypothetical protein
MQNLGLEAGLLPGEMAGAWWLNQDEQQTLQLVD